MKIILISKPTESGRSLNLGAKSLLLGFMVLLALPALVAFGAYKGFLYMDDPALTGKIAENWKSSLAKEKLQVMALQKQVESDSSALKVGLAKSQSRLIRLEALAERIAKESGFNKGEFNFKHKPALGGLSENIEGDAFAKPQLSTEIERLLANIDEQERQMEVLESLIAGKTLDESVFLAGRPIRAGWMSSFFGRRLDPFTGKLAQHKGVDFAGKEGADVIAVAAGVVTWSDKRYGYGLLVEIDHGGGYITRYAHNRENMVEAGDLVVKGQTLALMGSSGRSTGPHVHFEVLRNGRQVNPERYVYRADP